MIYLNIFKNVSVPASPWEILCAVFKPCSKCCKCAKCSDSESQAQSTSEETTCNKFCNTIYSIWREIKDLTYPVSAPMKCLLKTKHSGYLLGKGGYVFGSVG